MQRCGELARAATLFDGALARMPERARTPFLDLSPLLSPPAAAAYQEMSPAGRSEFARRFWDDADPDLVSPLNEARLEFLARAAHAYFLYYNPKVGAWDTRGDLYVRFGPPRWADRNPARALTYVNVSNWTWMVWGYPELGMRIWMSASNPLGSYMLPIAPGAAIPHPFPDSLAARPDLMTVGGGSAVFPRIPPGTRPLAVRCALARFEGDQGRRLLANVECPGDPADSLWVEWAVLDSSRQERARAGRAMTASACAPTEARASSFTADLPAGAYRVGVSVRDGHGRRGVFAGETEMGPPDAALGLSDVVVTCGQPQTSFAAGQPLRLELNPGARLKASDQLIAYFEVYHLMPNPSGWSRFQYVYTVRSAEKDARTWIQRALAPRRLPSPIEASREEETPGSVRRQYVTVPIRSLPAGTYEIEIRVEDLNSGASATGSAQFVREG
jgi:GWxTD domain-containing protein